jgi:hypothetical protein
MQPTAGPTASDAPAPPSKEGEVPVTTTTNTVPRSKGLAEPAATANPSSGGSTIMDKAAALVPAGVLSAAAAYLRKYTILTCHIRKTYIVIASSLNPTNAPTASDAAPTPTGEREGFNAPLPAIPSEPLTSAPHEPTQPLIGSTVSPDEDTQQALANAKNPDEYKAVAAPATGNTATPTTESGTETNTPVAQPKGQEGALTAVPLVDTVGKKNTSLSKFRGKDKKASDDNSYETDGSLMGSTQPIGGKTPITPTSGSVDAISKCATFSDICI